MLYNMSYPQDQRGASLPGPRAMTRPKQRSQSQYPDSFDPEDLSRRLNVVLAEQKARSERRRRARAEAARLADDGASSAAPPEKLPRVSHSDARKDRSSQDRAHHSRTKSTDVAHEEAYVPKVAAAQFERTTTAETLTQQSQVHRLSRRALKFHLSGPNALTATDPSATAAEQAKALRKAQHDRDRVFDRNQFQRDRLLEEAADADQEREQRHRQHLMHSIEARLSGARFSEDHGDAAKRLSGGELLKKLESRESATSALECAELPHDVNEHRVDWTQSDERDEKSKAKGAAQRLRKPQSIWTLKGRLTKHGRGEKGGSRGSEDAPAGAEVPKSPKSPITDFFARLKVSH